MSMTHTNPQLCVVFFHLVWPTLLAVQPQRASNIIEHASKLFEIGRQKWQEHITLWFRYMVVVRLSNGPHQSIADLQ
jgi:hypothetical protein